MSAPVGVAEVRALVHTRLSDLDLQLVIDREMAWLEGRVGALFGERTDTFMPGIGDTPLYLRRPADSVVLTDAGRSLAATEFLFTPSTGQIRRIVGYMSEPPHHPFVAGSWQGAVTATYTPSDEATVARAIIELVRGTVGETGFDSETLGDYSYTRNSIGSAGRISRAGLARGILLHRPAYSMRIRSAMEPV